MKQIRILTAMALAGILFAGCTKDNMNTLDNTAIKNSNTSNNRIVAPPKVIYNLAAEPILQDQQIQWNGGYMTTSALAFEGIHVNGNMLSMEKFVTNTRIVAKIFEPAVLGNVSVQPGFFNYGIFTIQLDPVNSMAPLYSQNPVNSTAAFFLNGTYNLNGTAIPVQLIINEPVMISAESIKNITISYFNTYTATLSLNVYRITDNISAKMIANAQETNGTILISGTSNQNLYKIMMTNLQNNVLQVQFSPQPPILNANPEPLNAAIPPNR